VFLPREAFKGLGPIRTFGRKVEFRIRYIFARRLALFGYARPPRIVPGPRSPGNVNAVGNSTAIGLFYQPQIPEITQMFTDFEAVISGLHSRVTEDDADFLAVFFPVRIQVSKRDWELLRRAYALDPSAFDLDYPNTRLGSFCRDRGIPFVDLLPSMKAVTETEGVSVFRRLGDMHLNERGQQISATAICDELIPNLGK
ncbi:MAG: hypothetical protein O7C75_05855, partial [Verrucomicrobia bacterium]|nr:hypothetical protein [Verrucomicrobiota bacterium]